MIFQGCCNVGKYTYIADIFIADRYPFTIWADLMQPQRKYIADRYHLPFGLIDAATTQIYS